MADFGENRGKSWKTRKSRVFPGSAGPAGGVLHQPLAPGPRGSRRGGGDPSRGGGWSRTSRGGLPEALRDPVPGRPRRVPRGPAARGWCKTPLAGSAAGPRGPRGAPPARGRGTPSRDSGGPGIRDPGDPVPRTLWGPGGLREALLGPWAAPGRPDGRGFTSTPRAGAPRFPGVRETPKARSAESLQASPGLEAG